MSRRRILLVSVATVLGGAEVYLERLTEILALKAHVVAVCIHPVVAQHLRLAGAQVIRIPAFMPKNVHRIAKYLVMFFVVTYIVVTRRIQTVHLNGYHSCYLAFTARLLGCFTLITPHHLPATDHAQSWYVTCARWVHCAINVSEFADAQHRAVLPSTRTVVIRNWISSIRSRLGTQTRTHIPQLLFVGRLVGNKGLPDLLEAVKLLDRAVHVVVAGEGPLRSEWEALSTCLPVRFVGFCDDLSTLYRESDALIVPSHDAETSCLAALEAMANGLPCIMSDLPAYREIAQDGASAMLYPVGDTAALAAAIQQVTSNRELAANLVESARNMVEHHYSFETGYAESLRVFGLESISCVESELALQ